MTVEDLIKALQRASDPNFTVVIRDLDGEIWRIRSVRIENSTVVIEEG